MALSTLVSVAGPTQQEWQKIKPVFERLYVEADLSLLHVMTILKQDYRFKATEKMFKDKIKAWRMSKNYSADDFRNIMLLLQNTTVDQYDSLLYRNRPIRYNAIVRRLQDIKRDPEHDPSFDNMLVFLRDIQKTMQSSRPASRGSNTSASSFESLNRVSVLGRPSESENLLAALSRYFEWWFTSHIGEQYFSRPGAQRPARAGPGTYGRPFSRVMHPAEFNQAYVRAVRLFTDGHYHAAFALLRRARNMVELLVKQQHPALISSLLFNFAGHWACRWHDARRTVLQFAASMADIVHGEHHLLTQLCRFLLENFEDGYGFMLWKRYSRVFFAKLGPTHRLTKYVNLMLLQTMIENERYNEAERHISEEMDVAFEADLGHPTPACICFMRRKARLHRLQGREVEAWLTLRGTFERLLAMLCNDHSPARHNLVVEETFRTIQELVMFYEAAGDYAQAMTTRHGALNVCLAVRGVHDSKTFTVISALHKCLKQNLRAEEARDLERRFPCVFSGIRCSDARTLSVQEYLGTETVDLEADRAVEVYLWLEEFLHMQSFMYQA